MTSTTELPHWETQPTDLAAATAEIKRALRERIERESGRSVEDVFADVVAHVEAEVADIEATRARGEEVWPVLDFADIAAGEISDEQRAQVRRRGCAVIRGTFDRAQAEQWDRDIVDYVEGNGFFDAYTGPADDFFESVMSKPEIYPIYWSGAQMAARTHPRMATAQGFLNSLWTHESEGRVWFDPDRDSLYPDRIRRRPPGTDSGGLGTHLDPGTLDLWMTAGYQEHFRHLFAGDVASYDPWDAAYRTEAAQYPGSTMCSAFRTFQGWTALSEMGRDQGVLHTVPIPKAMAYLMLRPLLSDVPETEMAGVRPNRTFPVNPELHPHLVRGLSGIPDVAPGDTVWWHCDMIHSVAPVTDQQGWGNVMYIPAAPWCAKNAEYAASVARALETGNSPADFPEENYEAGWPDRFAVSDLNEIGRRGLGL
ncbi:YbiU family protein [Naumannella huperziae]